MAKLPRRALGNTGLEVSILGFGASPLGGIFEDVDDNVGISAVHEAFRLGVNLFDTSPYYGATKSETVLGLALRGLPRDQIIVATKVGRYGPETFDFSADRVTRSVHESLKRLQLSYIDIIQCHDIEFGSLDQIISETLPALQQLKQHGLVRFVGITGLPLHIYKYVLERAPKGSVDVALSYCHYCLNDTTLQQLIPLLRDAGVGIINASPLSMGLLTAKGPPTWHPAPAELKDAVRAATDYCSHQGADISKLGLQFALRNSDIATTLVGMATPELVRQNVNTALETVCGGTDGPNKVLEQEVHRILSSVKDTTWPSGRPENN